MAQMWELDEALRLVRALQPMTRRFGYHLTLGGSVLNAGHSEKDLDLYFLPLDNKKLGKENSSGLLGYLRGLWGEPEPIDKDYEEAENPIPHGPEGVYAVGNNDVPLRDWGWVAVPPAWRDIANEEAPVAQFNIPMKWDIAKTVEPKRGVYKFKLKYVRPSGDRIDVFIL